MMNLMRSSWLGVRRCTSVLKSSSVPRNCTNAVFAPAWLGLRGCASFKRPSVLSMHTSVVFSPAPLGLRSFVSFVCPSVLNIHASVVIAPNSVSPLRRFCTTSLQGQKDKRQKRETLRLRKLRFADRAKYHPIIQKTDDPMKQWEVPRYVNLVEKELYGILRRLNSLPPYQPFFEPVNSSRKNAPQKEEIKRALRNCDIYAAWDFLGRYNFRGTTPIFLHALYEQLWKRSAHVTPDNLKQVLQIASTWLRIGIKPCNLFSVAYQLLPEESQFSRDAAVLCSFYKSMTRRMSLPQDDVIFPVLEDFLLDEASSMSLLELELMCSGFYESREPFQPEHKELICNLIEKRFLREIPVYGWDREAHRVLDLLKMNDHFNHEHMQSLLPALEESGFSEMCLRNPRFGITELSRMTSYLLSRRYRDEDLLEMIVETLRSLSKDRSIGRARCGDIGMLYRDLIALDAKLDDDLIDFALNIFRKNMASEIKDIDSRFLLDFLHALCAIREYPYDLIDAFFSNKRLMTIEDGRHMPALSSSFSNEPFDQLLQLDVCVELMCPGYPGARLPSEVRSVAERYVPPQQQRHRDALPPWISILANALNVVIMKSHRQSAKKPYFISVRKPASSDLRPTSFTGGDHIVIELDANNKPLTLDEIESLAKKGKRSARKIVVYMLTRHNYLRNPDGVNDRIKPLIRLKIDILKKQGFEVEIVAQEDSNAITLCMKFAYDFAAKLADRIMKR